MCAITEAVVATDMRRRRIQVRSRPPSPVRTVRALADLSLLSYAVCPRTPHNNSLVRALSALGAWQRGTPGVEARPGRNKIAPARSLFDVDVRLDRRPSICGVSWATPTSSTNTATLCSTCCDSDGLGLRGGAQGLCYSICVLHTLKPEEMNVNKPRNALDDDTLRRK
jgi:hypothetical protein